MAFPTSPTDGQIFENYKYNSTIGVWNIANTPSTATINDLTVGDLTVNGDAIYNITTDIGYSNGWSAYDETNYKPKIVVKNGVCYMSGLIIPGTINTVAFTLPVELRPNTNHYVSTINGESPYYAYLLQINNTGEVIPDGVVNSYRSISFSWVIGV